MSKREPKERGSKIQGLPYDSDLIEIWQYHDLPTSERLLLHRLRSRMNQKQKFCYSTQKQLGVEIGIKERHVRRLIQNLTERGIITIGKRKKNRKYKIHNQNEYRFIFPWNTE